jgi:peptidoglycan/LPS O-acetylase OafA/YrhL
MKSGGTPASSASTGPSREELLSAHPPTAAGTSEPRVNVAVPERSPLNVHADVIATDLRQPSARGQITEELRRNPTVDIALEHRKQIDGLRFFAFLAVFLVHSDITRFWWGSYGVCLFFVISGFLITRILIAYENRPRSQVLRNFYARRALRIFPAYYLVLGLAAATVGIAYLPAFALFVMNWGIFFYTWIQPELADIAWDPTRMYGIHFWSLCVEEQFYLVFPLVFSFLRPGRARLSWLLVLWGASIGVRFLCAAFLPKAAYGLIPLVCGEYLVAGAVGAVVFADTSSTAERIRAAARQWMFPAGIALVVALFALSRPEAPSIDHVMHPPHMQTLLALGFLAMVLGLWQTDNRWVLGFFNYAPLRFLGKISYGLYLIHLFMWPLFDWLSAYSSVIRELPPFAARLGLTVLLATAMWRLVEAPILKLKASFPY